MDESPKPIDLKKRTKQFFVVLGLFQVFIFVLFHIVGKFPLWLVLWTIVLTTALTSCGFYAARKRSAMLAPIVKSKKWMILFGMLLVFNLCCIPQIIETVRAGRKLPVRRLERGLNEAMDVLRKSPPGIARAEEFLRKLRAVDTQSTPDDLKQALQDYITATQQGLDVLKSGGSMIGPEKKMAAASEKLNLLLRIHH